MVRVVLPPQQTTPAEKRVNLKPAVGVTLTTYTLPETPRAGSVKVYKNGLLLTHDDDYVVTTTAGNSTIVQFVAGGEVVGPATAGGRGDSAVVLYTPLQ